MASAVRSTVAALDATLTEVKAVAHQDPDNRGKIFFIKPIDVRRLYSELHKKRLAVLAFGGYRVQLDVSEKFSREGSISLADFVDAKGFFDVISRPAHVDPILTRARDWISVIHLSNYRDERCLPWHTFSGGQERAVVARNKKGDFIDSKSRAWQAGPCHTTDLLQVAGLTLPVGYHWDVQSSRDTILVNGWQRWRIPGSKYANVHPNAHIRGQAIVKQADAFEGEGGAGKIPRKPKTPIHQRRSRSR